MKMFTRICAALAPLVMLSACLLTPGKFTSTLDIRKDRSFTFTYKGEVIASNPGEDLKDAGKDSGGDGDPSNTEEPAGEGASYLRIASDSSDTASEADKEADKKAKMQAIADALSKEEGFRSVRYLGGDKLEIDYAISGRLDHSFIFPFNIDAQAVFPFVAIEVRKDGKVRVQAPGFASDSSKSAGGMGGMGDAEAKERDGSFTLTTDAEIVSQNQEEGASSTDRGKMIVWKVTPLTRVAPMAVLKLN